MIPGLVSIFYKPRTAGNFAVVAAPTSAGGGGTAGPISAGPCVATPSGGVAPYTYQWVRMSGNGGMAIDAPTSASTTFSATLGPNAYVSASFFCRVTDASATVSESNIINVSLHATGS